MFSLAMACSCLISSAVVPAIVTQKVSQKMVVSAAQKFVQAARRLDARIGTHVVSPVANAFVNFKDGAVIACMNTKDLANLYRSEVLMATGALVVIGGCAGLVVWKKIHEKKLAQDYRVWSASNTVRDNNYEVDWENFLNWRHENKRESRESFVEKCCHYLPVHFNEPQGTKSRMRLKVVPPVPAVPHQYAAWNDEIRE